MRIALLNQYYPPAPAPTGQALADLARALAARGHEVHIVCSGSAYAGGAAAQAPVPDGEGVFVHRLGGGGPAPFRLAGKIAGQVAFAARLAPALLRLPRPHVLVALATPPYLGLMASRVPGWGRVPRVEWTMDVYPDVLAAHGLLAAGRGAFRLLEARARRQLGSASAVVALGPFMARALERRVADASRLHWVPLWGEAPLGPASADAVAEARAARGWTAGETVLLYSGNMGRGHRLSEFLEAAGHLGASGPRWVFRGGGFRRGEVEAFARARRDARVELLPYEPRAALRASLSAADVHLASLASAWQGLIVPSKVQAAFGVGRPVLFVGPRANESAAWILESGGGWVVGEDDAAGLRRAVDQARDPGERARRGAAGLAFAREHFDPARNPGRLARTVEEAAANANA